MPSGAPFRVAQYRFSLRLLGAMRLPRFKGSLLRGTLGYGLRRACWWGESAPPACRLCPMCRTCPYGYLFETSILDPKNGRPADMPRPFVINPPLDGQIDYNPDDRLAFDLLLVGRAIDYLPYFVAAYAEQGPVGLGKDWGRFELDRVEAVHPLTAEVERVFEGRAWLAGWERFVVERDDFAPASESDRSSARLTFLTPTRLGLSHRTISLVHEQTDRVAAAPVFPVLIDNLVRRVGLLSRTHCDAGWLEDREALLHRALDVESECETQWVEWSRISTRQEQKLAYGGLIGRATYRGDLAPFLPYLALGSLVHVGEKCDAGNGWYRIAAA